MLLTLPDPPLSQRTARRASTFTRPTGAAMKVSLARTVFGLAVTEGEQREAPDRRELKQNAESVFVAHGSQTSSLARILASSALWRVLSTATAGLEQADLTLPEMDRDGAIGVSARNLLILIIARALLVAVSGVRSAWMGAGCG